MKPLFHTNKAEAVKEIFEYRRKQMGVDDLEKYQRRYAFSSKIICSECDSLFRRQKTYIGKPYEKIQWCCRQHIFDSTKCSQKAVREDDVNVVFDISDVANTTPKKFNRYVNLLTQFTATIGKMSDDYKVSPWNDANISAVTNELSHDIGFSFSKKTATLNSFNLRIA